MSEIKPDEDFTFPQRFPVWRGPFFWHHIRKSVSASWPDIRQASESSISTRISNSTSSNRPAADISIFASWRPNFDTSPRELLTDVRALYEPVPGIVFYTGYSEGFPFLRAVYLWTSSLVRPNLVPIVDVIPNCNSVARRFWWIGLFLALWPGFLISQIRNYLPLTPSELGPPYKLKRLGIVGSRSTELHTAAGPSGSTYKVRTGGKASGTLVLQGKDKSDRMWQVDLIPLWGCAGGSQVYEGDLDSNGIKDAVLLTATCGNGLAPRSHIVTVTFDKDGQPLPFEAEGYFESLPAGIDSLVDLNRDGKANLVFMNFDDGYWITNIYALNDARWKRVTGRFGPRSFPLYTRFTGVANSKAVIPPPNRHPTAPDLSNMTPAASGTLTRWRWVSSGPASPYFDLQLSLLSPTGKPILCTTNYWYDSARLVLNDPAGRTVRRLSQEDSEFTEPILRDAVLKKQMVRVYGARSPDHCSPELVWVEP